MRHAEGAGLLALAVLVSAACRREEAPVPPPGMVDNQGAPSVSGPPPTPPRPAAAPAEPTIYDFERPAPPPSAPTAAQNLGLSPAPTGGGGTQAGAAERDLSAELSAALNQVTDCVDPALAATQPNGRLVVAVSAYVLGTGTISRAIIEASGQPAAALSCLQRRVLAIKLAEPVAGAPINVKGSAEVQVKALGTRAPPAPPPAQPTAPANDVARGQPDDMARPDQADLAGPP